MAAKSHAFVAETQIHANHHVMTSMPPFRCLLQRRVGPLHCLAQDNIARVTKTPWLAEGLLYHDVVPRTDVGNKPSRTPRLRRAF